MLYGSTNRSQIIGDKNGNLADTEINTLTLVDVLCIILMAYCVQQYQKHNMTKCTILRNALKRCTHTKKCLAGFRVYHKTVGIKYVSLS